LTRATLIVLSKILIAFILVAATVCVQAVGLAALLKALVKSHAQLPTRFWPVTWLLIRVTWALIFIHVTEIAVWALFFWWHKCLPDIESSFYFSGVTYATIGYGDLVLPKEWRLFGPVQGLTGILMCGLSTAFFFAVISKMLRARTETRQS
jgi:Ion channel